MFSNSLKGQLSYKVLQKSNQNYTLQNIKKKIFVNIEWRNRWWRYLRDFKIFESHGREYRSPVGFQPLLDFASGVFPITLWRREIFTALIGSKKRDWERNGREILEFNSPPPTRQIFFTRSRLPRTSKIWNYSFQLLHSKYVIFQAAENTLKIWTSVRFELTSPPITLRLRYVLCGIFVHLKLADTSSQRIRWLMSKTAFML